MQLIKIILLLIAVASIGVSQYISGFTCQGSTYATAIGSCPDNGKQRNSAGGNVTIHIRRATNLPNTDNTGPSAGVSDPYVKFTVGYR
jgi:hypothetical protein